MAVPLVPEVPWYEKDLDEAISFYLSARQKEALEEHAGSNGLSVSALIRFALNYWVERVEDAKDGE